MATDTGAEADIVAAGVDGGRWRRLWITHVTDVITATDADSDQVRANRPAESNRQAFVVLVVTALALISNEFLTRDPGWVTTPLEWLGLDEAAAGLVDSFRTDQLGRLTFWGTVQIVTYVAPAALVIRYVLRGRLSDYGLGIRGTGRHAWIYGVLLAISIPGIVFAASSPAFLAKYPFLDPIVGQPLFPDMAIWWVVYAAQFVALEFFFRGFMVHGLKARLGYAAVFVMAVPYAMIHFQKPMLEATMAIAGGVVLGTLSLGTRSIWWGAALHIAIAGTMDVLALQAKGFL